MAKPIVTTFDGQTLLMTRRRYSNATFTWVDVLMPLLAGETADEGRDGKWIGLGDPWPSINPPRKDLEREIARVQSERMVTA